MIGNAMIQSARHSRESSVCRGKKKKNKKEKAFNVKNCQIEAKSEKIFFKSLRN